MKEHQTLSFKKFRISSDFKVFKALNYVHKKNVNAHISQTMAASKLSLVSFESTSKNV